MATQAQKERFFREHYAYAIEAGLDPLRATLAVSQAALETGWGEVGQAVKGNNFHGMKVGDDWTGPSMELSTEEEDKGRRTTIKDRFRKYETPVQSYRDWAKKMAERWPGVLAATNLDEALKALDQGVKGNQTGLKYSTAAAYKSNVADIAGQLAQSGVPQIASTLPSIETASPFGLPDLDHPATPGWLSGPVAPTAVDIEDFSTASPSPMGGSLQSIADPDGYRTPLAEVDFTKVPGVEPHWATRLNEYRDRALAQGLNLGVDLGAMVRDQAKQNELAASGASKTKQSFHMLGLGADISPMDATKANKWASAQWGPMHALRDEMGIFGIGGWDPAHMQPFSGSAGPYMNLPRDEKGIVQLSPVSALQVAGGTWPEFQSVDALNPAPYGAVERAPLGDVLPDPYSAPVAAVERSPLADLASMLSPISSAQATEPLASDSLPSLQSDTLSPLGGYDTLVGQDVTDSFTGPSALMGTAVQPDISPQIGTDSVIDRLSPIDSSVVGTPVSTAEQLSAIPGPVVGSIEDSYIQAPLSDYETLSPLTSETLSPLSDYQTLTGTDVTLPDLGLYGGLLGNGTTLAQQTSALPSMTGFVSPVPSETPTEVVKPTATPTELPSLPPAKTVETPKVATVAPSLPTVDPKLDQFPEAPAPTISDMLNSRLARAGIGFLTGGLPGAAFGGLMGGSGLAGLHASGVVPEAARFSVGFGLPGIETAMGGPFGATGYSLSDPGAFVSSFGPGQGWSLTNQLGATTRYSADGHIIGSRESLSRLGNVLGSIFGGSNNNGDFSDAERSEFSGKAGLW